MNSKQKVIQKLVFITTIVFIISITLMIPAEKILGDRIRLIILHGTWVWVGLFFFALAGMVGLSGLLSRQGKLNEWSKVLGWTAMFFWLTYLPMSMLVMKLNWGGMFFAEPRWRIPFSFAVIGLLLQIGLHFMQISWLTSLINLLFGSLLFWQLLSSKTILHPDSPVFQPDAGRIQYFFIGLFLLLIILGSQIAFYLFENSQHKKVH
ncbi:MAG: hypothetical protein JEZ06_12260 [Anaerolineaceae bacterium]|nr:hypothetical protein [Anaerolineaceae bacterium]